MDDEPMPRIPFFLNDPPKRPESAPKTITQAAIEETFSFDGPPDATIAVAGKVYLYFAGNGYFGLQADPEVLAATCEAVLRYGVGTATTRIAFTSPPVFEVERRIAEMLGTSHALYTVSGYLANQIFLESLDKTFDRIFIDEASHYSLFDAAKRIRGTRRKPITFQHRNAADLREKLDGNLQLHERPMVITDGVFSQHGTIAPVDDYLDLLARYSGASLWIDDAHGFGVLGKTGRGTLEHFGIDTAAVNQTAEDLLDDFGFNAENPSPVHLYLTFSLSKAVGGSGGGIPGSESFIQRLKDWSAMYFGASAPASPIAAATAKSLSMLIDSELRRRLRDNVTFLRDGLQKIGLLAGSDSADSPLPMAVLTLGSAGNMRRIQKELSEKGILISYLPRNSGLGSAGALRIAVFATHTPVMIEELLDALREAV
ncbi:MAG: pyridoxal phosphate-dependent aminotransferase family protein [Planctomycetaceae bacterium]|jgi:7-keto-8-aminopelargonate synthetase-like enzyme|nr:pyridoxal phosphate-dependent aminotransferase family protein [Planctomycetaceae bacterium]